MTFIKEFQANNTSLQTIGTMVLMDDREPRVLEVEQQSNLHHDYMVAMETVNRQGMIPRSSEWSECSIWRKVAKLNFSRADQ